MNMNNKDFQEKRYQVDENMADTLTWLLHHHETYQFFTYHADTQELTVTHDAGVDTIRIGDYLNANYDILLTSS